VIKKKILKQFKDEKIDKDEYKQPKCRLSLSLVLF